VSVEILKSSHHQAIRRSCFTAAGQAQGRRPMRGWLPVVLVALVVAGCGGDGDDEAPGRFRSGSNGGQSAGSDNLPPTAVITTSQVAGPGLAVTSNGAASTDSDGFIVEHLWGFGDGT